MKTVKVISLIILSFLLVVFLSAFGFAFTIDNSVLQPDFIPNQIERLDIASLTEEIISNSTSDLSPDLRDSLSDAVTNLKPQIETQFKAANSRVYDYLLGRQAELDLPRILRETVLNREFVTSLILETDTLDFVRQDLRDKLVNLIPIRYQELTVYLDQAMPDLDPWLEKQAETIAGPVVDYLLGETLTLHVVVDLTTIKTALEPGLRNAFLNSPPSEFSDYSSVQLENIFNEYFDAFAAQIPGTANIDPSTLGISPSVSWAQSLSEAETALTNVRQAIGYFRVYFILLIVLIVLCTAGIILIHRNVKGASLDLGIIFLTFGAMEFIGILIANYFIKTGLNTADLPAAFRAWVPQLFSALFRPLEFLSVALAIIGIGLIVLSVVYRKRPAQDAPQV